jgi:molybdate transport system substrate-binding protein
MAQGSAARRLTWAAVLGLGIVLAPAARADQILVFAAASLKTALDQVNQGFAAASAHRAKASYAASSALARQIEQGAPADVFFSADLDWLDYLEARSLIQVETRVELLGNELVLIGPAGAPSGSLTLGPEADLTALLGRGRLALAQVDSAPAGKYAKAALEKLGLWRQVEGRLAQAENVRAALALVARGETPLGIVYRTDALAEPGVTILATFPAESHPPIIYPVALTREAGAAGHDYLAFLRSPAAREVFQRHGFVVLSGPAP